MTLIKSLLKNTKFWFTLWILWMGVIFYFSSMSGSPTYYEPPIKLLIERKGAHVVEYATLFLLSLQVFSLWYQKASLRALIALAFAWTLMYAVTDELHQYFIPFRGASFRDVGIDMGGMLLAFLIVLIIGYGNNKKTAQ